MDNATSPETGTADAVTFDQSVDEIAALLVDPDETPDLPSEDEGRAETEDGSPGPDEAEANAEDVVDDNGPEEVAAGGKFVSRDAKVRLDDGTVISVGDLARNNLYQRDYTRKTEELKAERTSLQSDRSQVGEIAQALAAQREFLMSVAQQVLPQPPDRAMLDPNSPKFDPVGHAQAKEEYEEKTRLLTQVYYQQQSEDGRKQEETKAQKAERRRLEAERMVEAIPEFRDQAKYQQFCDDANDLMVSEYGFTNDELGKVIDHRYIKVIRDVVRLHKALRKAPKVQADMQGKPKLLKGGARQDPKARNSREAVQRTEKLRKTGDFDAGVAALMDLI